MKRKLLLLTATFFWILAAQAQNSGLMAKKKKNPLVFDAPPKWMMGLKVGYNKSTINIKEPYTVFSPLDFTSSASEKTYDRKKTGGYQFGLNATYFPINNIGISFQPTLFTYKYAYSTSFNWEGETGNLNYSLENKHSHTLRYIEIPLLLKLYPVNGKVHAFVQGGAYISKLINAKKSIESKGIDRPGGDEFVSKQENHSMDVNDLYIKSYTGWVIGAGAGFNADTFRFSLEANYRRGLNNITNEKNRFSNNQLVNSFYDVPDDISFKNIEISLSCSLPLDNLVSIAKKAEPIKKIRR